MYFKRVGGKLLKVLLLLLLSSRPYVLTGFFFSPDMGYRMRRRPF